MELSTLVKMSNTYGSNPAYVLAGGGNTSVKDDTTLYVKGSGTQLATIKAEEFVKMDRARLNEIMKTEYPADDVTMDVDLTDGEGYISLYGSTWDSLEENYQCNFCLKAYTDNME